MGTLSHASAQGDRAEQQDRFVVTPVKGGQLLAVMDGHGGRQTAEILSRQLPIILERTFWEFRGDGPKALKAAFDQLAQKTNSEPSGSTLSVVLIPESGSRAEVGILGDSPVAILQGTQKISVSPMHNARTSASERTAAEKRGALYTGGYLEDPQSPGSGVQLSRALGDAGLARILNREPEIYSVPFEKGDFILLATDGILDSFEDVEGQMQRVMRLVQQGHDAQSLVEDAVRRGTGDNVTVIIWKA